MGVSKQSRAGRGPGMVFSLPRMQACPFQAEGLTA